MKYIKTYEAIHNPKFDINDVVKIKGDETNTLYIVDGYDYRQYTMVKDVCRLKKYSDKDKLAKSEGFFSWRNEDLLEKATEEEINSYKYNL